MLENAYMLLAMLLLPIFPLSLLIQLGIDRFLVLNSFLKIVFLLVLFDLVYILDVLWVFTFLCL